MKKIILILLSATAILTGCGDTEDIQTTSADNSLLEVNNIERVQTAANVDQVSEYTFAVDSDVVSGYDTYNLLDTVTISSDDDVVFSVAVSDDSETTDLDFQEVTGSTTFDATKSFVTIKTDGTNQDFVVSVK